MITGSGLRAVDTLRNETKPNRRLENLIGPALPLSLGQNQKKPKAQTNGGKVRESVYLSRFIRPELFHFKRDALLPKSPFGLKAPPSWNPRSFANGEPTQFLHANSQQA